MLARREDILLSGFIRSTNSQDESALDHSGIAVASANNRESAGTADYHISQSAPAFGIDLMRDEGKVRRPHKKPGAVSRPGALRQFQFPEYLIRTTRSTEKLYEQCIPDSAVLSMQADGPIIDRVFSS
jgi:hypothetical protein